jgi:hypothetical protein
LDPDTRAAEKVPDGAGRREPAIWEDAKKAGVAMTRPLFLSIEDVIEIHADQIQRYGGSLGVRDAELLEALWFNEYHLSHKALQPVGTILVVYSEPLSDRVWSAHASHDSDVAHDHT